MQGFDSSSSALPFVASMTRSKHSVVPKLRSALPLSSLAATEASPSKEEGPTQPLGPIQSPHTSTHGDKHMACPRSIPTHLGIPMHPVERGPREKRRLGAERPQPRARPWRPTMQKKNITQQQLAQERRTARRACLPHKRFEEIHGSIDAKPAIAQLVEHLTVECCSNQMVPDSIPGGRIFLSLARCDAPARTWC